MIPNEFVRDLFFFVLCVLFLLFFFFYSRLFSVEPILVWRLTNISFCSAIRSVLMVLESFYETFFLHFYFLQNEMRLNEINETDRCAQKLLRFFDIKSIENGMSNGLIFVPLLWQNEVKKKYILVTLCYVHRRWFLFPLSYRSYVFYTTFSLLAFKPNWQRECEAERQRENEQEKTKKNCSLDQQKNCAHKLRRTNLASKNTILSKFIHLFRVKRWTKKIEEKRIKQMCKNVSLCHCHCIKLKLWINTPKNASYVNRCACFFGFVVLTYRKFQPAFY